MLNAKLTVRTGTERKIGNGIFCSELVTRKTQGLEALTNVIVKEGGKAGEELKAEGK